MKQSSETHRQLAGASETASFLLDRHVAALLATTASKTPSALCYYWIAASLRASR